MISMDEQTCIECGVTGYPEEHNPDGRCHYCTADDYSDGATLGPSDYNDEYGFAYFDVLVDDDPNPYEGTY